MYDVFMPIGLKLDIDDELVYAIMSHYSSTAHLEEALQRLQLRHDSTLPQEKLQPQPMQLQPQMQLQLPPSHTTTVQIPTTSITTTTNIMNSSNVQLGQVDQDPSKTR